MRAAQERIFSEQEVRGEATSGRSLLIYDGGVYDVGSMMAGHPGGSKLVEAYIGKDITHVFLGKGRGSHPHTETAQRALAALRVGEVRVEDAGAGPGSKAPASHVTDRSRQLERAHGIDNSRGLVFQVGRLGKHYHDWLETPNLRREPQHMFDSWLMEAASKTPWWTVPLLWAPLALFSLLPLLRDSSRLWLSALCFLLGRSIWWLVEYCLHRFLFHATPTSYWGITLHYAFHGCHHKYPNDRLRLVFPPAFAMPLIAGFYAACHAALPDSPAAAGSLFSGGLMGYIFYDCIHHFAHSRKFKHPWLARIQRRHLGHHYGDSSRSFGVSSPVFDVLFGTLPAATGIVQGG